MQQKDVTYKQFSEKMHEGVVKVVGIFRTDINILHIPPQEISAVKVKLHILHGDNRKGYLG